MKRSRHQLIRDLLLASKDGMTIKDLVEGLADNDDPKSIQKTVKNIHGVYIDRWAVPRRGQFAAVYMCVDVPSNSPHPTERYLPKTLWQPTKQRDYQ